MATDIKEASFPLDVGEVVITYPESISEDEIGDVENWMKIMIRKLRRTTGSSSSSAGANDEFADDDQTDSAN